MFKNKSDSYDDLTLNIHYFGGFSFKRLTDFSSLETKFDL